MAKYVRVDGMKLDYSGLAYIPPNDGFAIASFFANQIENLPAVDVAPVVHGKWEMNSDRPDTIICSNCDNAFDVWKHDHKRMSYCPNCGARMDLDTADNEQPICKSALNKWGKENQTRMMFEEMAELQKELCKEARGEDNTDAIAEEIADVKIMLEQMIILHGCKDMVGMQMERKLQRLKKRLEGEQ